MQPNYRSAAELLVRLEVDALAAERVSVKATARAERAIEAYLVSLPGDYVAYLRSEGLLPCGLGSARWDLSEYGELVFC